MGASRPRRDRPLRARGAGIAADGGRQGPPGDHRGRAGPARRDLRAHRRPRRTPPALGSRRGLHGHLQWHGLRARHRRRRRAPDRSAGRPRGRSPTPGHVVGWRIRTAVRPGRPGGPRGVSRIPWNRTNRVWKSWIISAPPATVATMIAMPSKFSKVMDMVCSRSVVGAAEPASPGRSGTRTVPRGAPGARCVQLGSTDGAGGPRRCTDPRAGGAELQDDAGGRQVAGGAWGGPDQPGAAEPSSPTLVGPAERDVRPCRHHRDRLVAHDGAGQRRLRRA